MSTELENRLLEIVQRMETDMHRRDKMILRLMQLLQNLSEQLQQYGNEITSLSKRLNDFEKQSINFK